MNTHEQIVKNSWAIFSIFVRSFSGVIVVLYYDIVNQIFCINLIIFVGGLPMDTMWWIRIQDHRSKLNRTSSIVITQFPSQLLKKLYFLVLKSVETSLKFWDWIKTTKFVFRIYWDIWIYIIFLDMVVCGCLCILVISATLVSQKMRLVECGIFHMGEPGFATITVYLVFKSKWIDPLS